MSGINKEEAARQKELGNRAFQAHNYIQALEAYTRAIDNDPNEPVYRSNRSAAYFALGLWQQAIDDAAWACELSPKVGKYYFRKGQAQAKLGQFYEAKLSFQMGLKHEAGNTDLQKALADLPSGPNTYSTRKAAAARLKDEGNQFYQKKNFRKAIEIYSQAIESDPSEIVYFSNRSACFYELDDMDHALEDCLKAVWIFRQGNSFNTQTRVVSKVFARLGEIYKRKGMKADAAAAFRESLKAEDSEGIRAKLQEVLQ